MKITMQNITKHWKLMLLIIIIVQSAVALLFYALDIKHISIPFLSASWSINEGGVGGLVSALVFLSYLYFKKE